MTVFLRLDKGGTLSRSIKLDAVEGVQIVNKARSRYVCYLTGTGSAHLIDKEGEEVKDGIVKAGQRITLKLGTLTTDKYHIRLVVNPEIARSGYLGGTQLIEPYESEELEYLFKAEKQIDFSKLDYLLKVYVLD